MKIIARKVILRLLAAACLILPLFSADAARAETYSRENAVVRAVRKVSPAVVNISSETPIEGRQAPFGNMDPLFEWFFRDFFESDPRRQYERSSLGSGVIIDGRRGFILTNAHVISQTGKITVTLKDEREFEASIVGADPDSDLAVLRIDSQSPLPSVEMGDSSDLMIGEDVIAIGNPFGFSHTVTTGVISAVNRNIRAENAVYQDFIQTDASINPGNSGGPLLNINGVLIGINTAIYAKAQGIGFAIPIHKARRVVADLIEHGEVTQTWIGITVQGLNEQMARYFKVPAGGGVLVRQVEPDSPAQVRGIRDGDILLALGGIKIRSVGEFNAAMKGLVAGESVEITLWRNGAALKKSVQAAAFPLAKAPELGYRLFGVRVKDAASGRGGGAVITMVRPDSYLAEIGVRPGDVIHQIDDTAIQNAQEFERAAVKNRNKASVVLLVQRGDRGYYITLRL
ncbi:Do family serine endopeptidase [Desulfococcus sp.]|uniref:Do family serine endopeptidase n=1 Tax=Desulfococcus sp. TaxID=2025834 RepID=UPI003593447C